MRFIYNAIDEAKEMIAKYFRGEAIYKEIQEIINEEWEFNFITIYMMLDVM